MSDAATDNETVTLKDGVTSRSGHPARRQGRDFRGFQKSAAGIDLFALFLPEEDADDEELKSLTEVDFENEVALVVTTGGGEKETIIGVGRFARLDSTAGRRSAELAFTVEEDFHGQGIASCLLERLACLAVKKHIAIRGGDPCGKPGDDSRFRPQRVSNETINEQRGGACDPVADGYHTLILIYSDANYPTFRRMVPSDAVITSYQCLRTYIARLHGDTSRFHARSEARPCSSCLPRYTNSLGSPGSIAGMRVVPPIRPRG